MSIPSPPPYGIYFIKNPHNDSPNMIVYISNALLIRKNKNHMKETHPVLSRHEYFVIVYDTNDEENDGTSFSAFPHRGNEDTRYVLDYNTLANTMRKALDTEEYNQYQLNDHFGYKYGIDFFD